MTNTDDRPPPTVGPIETKPYTVLTPTEAYDLSCSKSVSVNRVREVEQAVLAKQAQAATGQSGEVEGLLREADRLVAETPPHECVELRAAVEALAAALRAQGPGEPLYERLSYFERGECFGNESLFVGGTGPADRLLKEPVPDLGALVEIRQQWNKAHRTCGENAAGVSISDIGGCGASLEPRDIYRCVDCGTPFCRQCLKRHFGQHAAPPPAGEK